MTGKTHRTAVAIIPPEEIWEPIQAIRRRYDRQIHRWMPHVNMLYPFLPSQRFHQSADLLARALAKETPFRATLTSFQRFVHGSGRSTLWLAPQPKERFVHLQRVLEDAIPGCDDLSRYPGGFTPHLSVGQSPSRKSAERIIALLRGDWEPLSFEVAAVALISRPADGPFAVKRWVPLGGGGGIGPMLSEAGML